MKKNKRILVSCFEVPGYGGANTAGYHLFERLHKDGWDVHYLNIINREDIIHYYMFLERTMATLLN